MATRFVKIVGSNYRPNGAVGKITEETSIMGLVRVDVVNYGPCNVWLKNIVEITKKEYFIKVLQGKSNDKL